MTVQTALLLIELASRPFVRKVTVTESDAPRLSVLSLVLLIVVAIWSKGAQAVSLPSSLAVAFQRIEGFNAGHNPETTGNGAARGMGRGVELPAHLEQSNSKKDAIDERTLTKETRRAFIQRAQVWTPTRVSEMDIRTGPEGTGAFQPNDTVSCDYVRRAQLSGSTRKFYCDVGNGDVVKVRYGKDNGEVEAGVLASRLLWALGFGADRVYPVRVMCRGCSPDPWNRRERIPGEQMFDPATIERKPSGHDMSGEDKGGWSWAELDLIDERQGGASKAQRDALKLLAVFMQHTDSKPQQQRLLCLPGGLTDSGCDRPFMMVHDVGMTFGHANMFNRNGPGSVNFTEWSKTPMWRDAPTCVGNMSKSSSGTLANPKISEAGRQFLADLLVQLTDTQLRDLFEAARIDRRSRKPGSTEPPATVDEWVTAFKSKREEIVMARCTS
jgi:hypothetical protein